LRARHLEDVIDRGVFLVTEPGQGLDSIEIDQTIVQYLVPDVNAEHLA